jgi:hypothetical protein
MTAQNGFTRRDMWILLGVAFLLRAFVALTFWNVVAFDEVFQVLEAAHRLVFGQGLVPWEFQVGLRSWLIPLALTPPMALGRLVSANPLVGLAIIRLLMVAASLPIVWCAAMWGQRFYGRRGGWIAGSLAAFWPDLWVLAPHTLEEVFGADVLVPAIYLVEAARGEARVRHIACAGFLLGLVVMLRLQLAPAIAVAGILLCRRDWRRWAIALAAAAVPVLVAGGLDWVSWGQPFRSIWLNVYLNLFKGVAASEFDASPPGFFASGIVVDWLWTAPVLLVFAWLGAKRLLVAGVAALAILLVHSLIPHKEFRFIFPAIALAVPLAGVGLAGWLAVGSWRRAGLAVLLLAGPFCSPWNYFLLTLHRSSVTVFDDLRRARPALVAVGPWQEQLLPLDVLLTGKTRLTSLAVFDDPAAPRPDFVVAAKNNFAPPSGYALQRCYAGGWVPFQTAPPPALCVWQREQGRAGPGAVPLWNFPFFPAAARPFAIPHRLGSG